MKDFTAIKVLEEGVPCLHIGQWERSVAESSRLLCKETLVDAAGSDDSHSRRTTHSPVSYVGYLSELVMLCPYSSSQVRARVADIETVFALF